MKLGEIKEIAQKHGIKSGKMNKTELVHAIQGGEGNNKCFNTGISSMCGGVSCLWRDDCDSARCH